MAASENLSNAQFPKAEESTRAERKREREYGTKGADTDQNFGFSEDDPPDYLYERRGKKTTGTKPKRDVF